MLSSSAKLHTAMRLIITVSLLAFIVACAEGRRLPNTYTRSKEPVKFQKIDLKDIFEGRQLSGQILLYDESANQYTSSDFEAAKTLYSPASTFKIPKSHS